MMHASKYRRSGGTCFLLVLYFVGLSVQICYDDYADLGLLRGSIRRSTRRGIGRNKILLYQVHLLQS